MSLQQSSRALPLTLVSSLFVQSSRFMTEPFLRHRETVQAGLVSKPFLGEAFDA
jgi:hypothetical protein